MIKDTKLTKRKNTVSLILQELHDMFFYITLFAILDLPANMGGQKSNIKWVKSRFYTFAFWQLFCAAVKKVLVENSKRQRGKQMLSRVI